MGYILSVKSCSVPLTLRITHPLIWCQHKLSFTLLSVVFSWIQPMEERTQDRSSLMVGSWVPTVVFCLFLFSSGDAFCFSVWSLNIPDEMICTTGNKCACRGQQQILSELNILRSGKKQKHVFLSTLLHILLTYVSNPRGEELSGIVHTESPLHRRTVGRLPFSLRRMPNVWSEGILGDD